MTNENSQVFAGIYFTEEASDKLAFDKIRNLFKQNKMYGGADLIANSVMDYGMNFVIGYNEQQTPNVLVVANKKEFSNAERIAQSYEGKLDNVLVLWGNKFNKPKSKYLSVVSLHQLNQQSVFNWQDLKDLSAKPDTKNIFSQIFGKITL